ncbi:MAG TPA: HD domain-containing protein [Candidatus Limnocylindria bacterium]|nr:HD domain-containing protein [Candidatus Limnocylindria bacterium]
MAALAPPHVPGEVLDILRRLWSAGHAAYAVGGGVRDALLGRTETDWDVATDARPERLLELFPGSSYTNRFGTVGIGAVEATTFRRDHRYGDHRRPDEVTFTHSLTEDLARRDFTVNAIAWGRQGDSVADRPVDPDWVDPHDGLGDLRARLLRAVGDPTARFDEDALRLLRAARLAAQLDFEIEPGTLAAMRVTAPLVRWVSAERVGAELRRMLAADPPSRGLRILAQTDLLEPLLPELALQRGVAQDKLPGHDVWLHSLATLDAAARLDPGNERLRLAALLHDVGKPTTQADGRFIGHDVEGARLAERLLSRLAFPRPEVGGVAWLVRQHMFRYQPSWSAAAVRRFIRRVGAAHIDDLLKLRQADNEGSGLDADADRTSELRRRIEGELAAGVPLGLGQLAVDGDDLTRELGLPPGPIIGRLLERLLESVVSDPARNTRELLLTDARVWAADMKAAAEVKGEAER